MDKGSCKEKILLGKIEKYEIICDVVIKMFHAELVYFIKWSSE